MVRRRDVHVNVDPSSIVPYDVVNEVRGPTGIRWELVRLDYVTGSDSLEKVANKYDLTTQSVYDHARTGGWTEDRAIYRGRLDALTDEMVMRDNADRISRSQGLMITLANDMLLKVHRALPLIEIKDSKSLAEITRSSSLLFNLAIEMRTKRESTATIIDVFADNELQEELQKALTGMEMMKSSSAIEHQIITDNAKSPIKEQENG